MPYRIAGQYVTNCSCMLICPCAVDGQPTGPDGKCHGTGVWKISEGNLDDIDLSGVAFALFYNLPSNFTAGNLKMRLVVDEGASAEQADALQRIIGGQEGGPFEEFVPLIADFSSTDRARITFTNGDSPSASIGSEVEIVFEPLRGPDGGPTTVKNAMLGFAPEFTIGKASGSSSAPGFEYEGVYGEAADFEYSSEMAGELRPRA